MKKSKIFTNAELKTIKDRENKDYSDKHGVYSSRVKPKILELLTVWFPKKKDLKLLVKNKKKHGGEK